MPDSAFRLGLRARFAPALAAAAFAALAAPPSAQAQEPLPATPPPPASARAPNGEYVAPLLQQTQPTYVPQSVALSGPPIIGHYEPGAPVPQGYHAETRVRRGLIIGGAIPLGIMYTLSVLAGAALNDTGEGGEFMYVPVLGPFLQMTKTDNSAGSTILALDGLTQVAGAAMLVAGLTIPKTVLVRNDLAQIRVTPMPLGQRGGGLGFVGTF